MVNRFQRRVHHDEAFGRRRGDAASGPGKSLPAGGHAGIVTGWSCTRGPGERRSGQGRFAASGNEPARPRGSVREGAGSSGRTTIHEQPSPEEPPPMGALGSPAYRRGRGGGIGVPRGAPAPPGGAAPAWPVLPPAPLFRQPLSQYPTRGPIRRDGGLRLLPRRPARLVPAHRAQPRPVRPRPPRRAARRRVRSPGLWTVLPRLPPGRPTPPRGGPANRRRRGGGPGGPAGTLPDRVGALLPQLPGRDRRLPARVAADLVHVQATMGPVAGLRFRPAL